MSPISASHKAPQARVRARWLKVLHQWHSISSALSLAGLLLFSVTGLTLNHAADIEAEPSVTTLTIALPAELRVLLAQPANQDSAMLPQPVRQWLRRTSGVDVATRAAEWSDTEIYVDVPQPGGDAWLSINRASGEVEVERTSRGWVAYLNDLHKGRNTGRAWFWFIDLFALACLIFAVTGFFLLYLHARHRPATWPMVGLGLSTPLLLVVLFIH